MALGDGSRHALVNGSAAQLLHQSRAVHPEEPGGPVLVAAGTLESLSDQAVLQLREQAPQIHTMRRQIDQAGVSIAATTGGEVVHRHTSLLRGGVNGLEGIGRQAERDDTKTERLGGQRGQRLLEVLGRSTVMPERRSDSKE